MPFMAVCFTSWLIPDNFCKFVFKGRRLTEAYEHHNPAYHLQARGKYLSITSSEERN
ncbi:MAG: hypothetical protein RMK94_03760 [Armatimonadota bacterium]|nr:hypothetical protein [Armatimonadota bacterium]